MLPVVRTPPRAASVAALSQGSRKAEMPRAITCTGVKLGTTVPGANISGNHRSCRSPCIRTCCRRYLLYSFACVVFFACISTSRFGLADAQYRVQNGALPPDRAVSWVRMGNRDMVGMGREMVDFLFEEG